MISDPPEPAGPLTMTALLPCPGGSLRWWTVLAEPGRMRRVPAGQGDFTLTLDELRTVAGFAVGSAQEVLAIFEDAHPEDERPRAAIEAAYTFADGGDRTKLQRVASLDAHRAAKIATRDAAAHAARAAGDAASAAYLHPLAKAEQVGHILRATANAARAAELHADDAPALGDATIRQASQRATPVLIDVLGRYPRASVGKNRVAQLMKSLDDSLRTPMR